MLYKILHPLIKLFIKFTFHPKIIGLDNIPKTGPLILAGNHTNNLDCLLLIGALDRPIHFLGKHTLFKGIKKYLFKAMKVIPVDRTKKRNKEAIAKALEELNKGEVLGIFPEATINRTDKVIMPFKIGTVYFASKTTASIVPFVIEGKFRPKGHLKLQFLSSYKVTKDDLNEENEKLMRIICNALGGKN